MAAVAGVPEQVTSITALSADYVALGTLPGIGRVVRLGRDTDASASWSAATVVALPAPEGGRIGGIARGVLADDGPTVLTASNDAVVRVWRLGDLSEAEAVLADPDRPADALLAVPPTAELREHKLGCQAVVTLSTNRILSGGYDGRLCQWDAESLELVQIVDLGTPILCLCEVGRETGETAGGAATPTGPRAVAAATSNGGIELVDIRGGGRNRRLGVLGAHAEQVNWVASVSAHVVASAGCDDCVHFWDVRRFGVRLPRETTPAAAEDAEDADGGDDDAGDDGSGGVTRDPSDGPWREYGSYCGSLRHREWVYATATAVTTPPDSAPPVTLLWTASADGRAGLWDVTHTASVGATSTSSVSSAAGSSTGGPPMQSEARQWWGSTDSPPMTSSAESGEDNASWIALGSLMTRASDGVTRALASRAGGKLVLLEADTMVS